MTALDRLLGTCDSSCAGRRITRVFMFHVDDDGWSMIRLDEDSSQRCTARFRGPGVMDSTGEASRDHGTTWQPDSTMTYQRAQGETR